MGLKRRLRPPRRIAIVSNSLHHASTQPIVFALPHGQEIAATATLRFLPPYWSPTVLRCMQKSTPGTHRRPEKVTSSRVDTQVGAPMCRFTLSCAVDNAAIVSSTWVSSAPTTALRHEMQPFHCSRPESLSCTTPRTKTLVHHTTGGRVSPSITSDVQSRQEEITAMIPMSLITRAETRLTASSTNDPSTCRVGMMEGAGTQNLDRFLYGDLDIILRHGSAPRAVLDENSWGLSRVS